MLLHKESNKNYCVKFKLGVLSYAVKSFIEIVKESVS